MPKHITQSKGKIVLGYMKNDDDSEHLNISKPPRRIVRHCSFELYHLLRLQIIPLQKTSIFAREKSLSKRLRLNLAMTTSLSVSLVSSTSPAIHFHGSLLVFGDSGNRSDRFSIN